MSANAPDARPKKKFKMPDIYIVLAIFILMAAKITAMV